MALHYFTSNPILLKNIIVNPFIKVNSLGLNQDVSKKLDLFYNKIINTKVVPIATKYDESMKRRNHPKEMRLSAMKESARKLELSTVMRAAYPHVQKFPAPAENRIKSCPPEQTTESKTRQTPKTFKNASTNTERPKSEVSNYTPVSSARYIYTHHASEKKNKFHLLRAKLDMDGKPRKNAQKSSENDIFIQTHPDVSVSIRQKEMKKKPVHSSIDTIKEVKPQLSYAEFVKRLEALSLAKQPVSQITRREFCTPKKTKETFNFENKQNPHVHHKTKKVLKQYRDVPIDAHVRVDNLAARVAKEPEAVSALCDDNKKKRK